jgi:hypothetical protein
MHKIQQINYYGFDHDKISAKLSGDLTFCNSLCVKGEYKPVGVYKAKNPDKSKGHKKYVLIHIDEFGGLIRGMTPKEMKLWRYQEAAHCHGCNDIIFSVYRHDYHACTCGKVTIDGGKDYTKVSYESGHLYTVLTIDLITRKIVGE